jgi:hypothetical protein
VGNFQFLLLPLWQVQFLFLAFLNGAQNRLRDTNHPAGFAVKAGDIFVGIEFEYFDQLAKFGRCVHLFFLASPMRSGKNGYCF